MSRCDQHLGPREPLPWNCLGICHLRGEELKFTSTLQVATGFHDLRLSDNQGCHNPHPS
jgi:hypothetical protein